MRPSMKRAVMSMRQNDGRDDRRRDYDRDNYRTRETERNNYGNEFDRRRYDTYNHYGEDHDNYRMDNNMRYRMDDDDRIESRRGRDSRGRYTSTRSRYDSNDESNGFYPYILYNENRRRSDTPKATHKIGFAVEGEMEKIPDSVNYPMDSNSMYGRSHRSEDGEHMTREMATEWTHSMENEDGTRGAHWTLEQTRNVQHQKGIDCDELEFWVAMNMIYSDYSKVAKKMNVNNIDFYSLMAKAFLDDKDASDDKLVKYYEYVVK